MEICIYVVIGIIVFALCMPPIEDGPWGYEELPLSVLWAILAGLFWPIGIPLLLTWKFAKWVAENKRAIWNGIGEFIAEMLK